MRRRPDLDGARLQDPDGPNVWLVFDGRRHRIQSPAVYDALFSETDMVVVSHELDDIEIGPELNDGTCLARAQDTLPIYLVSGFPKVLRYFVPTYDTLLNFAFDIQKVRDVPSIILDTIPVGNELVSASERETP